MSQPDRFDIVVPLHEISGWRRALAVDRGGVAPRAVVISYPPSALTDDPTRLVGLMRDAEAAALVHHPNAVPSLGLETSGDLLVAVEAYRRGVSLRALLGVARRLPPELAARVAVDACAALASVHAVDPGDGHPLAHGGITAERLLVADDGVTLLCGTGTAGGGAQADDVRAIGAVLLECLLGDPSAPPGELTAASEIPPQLLEVARRAVGEAPGGAFEDAEALDAAIREAIRPAPPEAMAAYLEAIMPAGEGERGELLRLVANALSRAAQPAPAEGARDAAPAAPTSAADVGAARAAAPMGEQAPVGDPDARGAAVAVAPPPAQEASPVAAAGGPAHAAAGVAPRVLDLPAAAPPPGGAPAVAPTVAQVPPAEPLVPAAGTSPAPAAPSLGGGPRASRSRTVLAVAISMAIVGFGGGLLFARSGRAPAQAPAVAPAPVAAAPAPVPGSAPAPASPGPAAVASSPSASSSPGPASSSPAAAAAAGEVRPGAAPPATPPAPAAATPPAGPTSISVSAEPPGEVYVDGKRVGRSPVTVPVARGDHDVRLRSTYEGVDVHRRVTVRGAGTPVRFALRRGSLKVTAPQDAEVFVDGKHVGRGDVKVDLWEGNHLVEARLGQARVHEKFTLGPGETWTYDVTPTP